VAGQQEEVVILDDREITLYPKLREPKKYRQIVFRAPGLRPATIRLPVEEATEEAIREAIKAKIEELRRAPRPRTLIV